MSIVRVASRTRFLVVEQEAVDNASLSYGALGLLCYLLGRPDSWEVRVTALAEARNTTAYAVRGLLRELSEAGYARLHHERSQTGHVQGSQWVIYERPDSTEIAKSAMSAPRLRITETRQSPNVGKSDTLPNKELGLTNTDPSLTRAREGVAPEKTPAHPAVSVYQDLTGRRSIPLDWAERIKYRVGDEPSRLAAWADLCATWKATHDVAHVGKPYNLGNVPGMLDAFEEKAGPRKNGSTLPASKARPRGALTFAEVMDAVDKDPDYRFEPHPEDAALYRHVSG